MSWVKDRGSTPGVPEKREDLRVGAGALGFAAVGPVALAAAPYTSETSYTTNMYWIKALTNGGGAEFVPDASTADLGGVKLYLANDGAPSSSHVQLAVQPTCNGPSSSALATATADVSSIPSGTYNPNNHWSVTGGGWITYQLTDGPAKGLVVYLAEDVTPTVQVGQQVTPHTVIANMYNGGAGIETGWAMPDSSSAESQLPAAGSISGNGPFPTAVGINFEHMLEALGVPPSPFNANAAPYGILPANYPASYASLTTKG